jgi:hypothetical protein
MTPFTRPRFYGVALADLPARLRHESIMVHYRSLKIVRILKRIGALVLCAATDSE